MLLYFTNQVQEIWQKCVNLNLESIKRLFRGVNHTAGVIIFTLVIFILGGLFSEYKFRTEIDRLIYYKEADVSLEPRCLINTPQGLQDRMYHVQNVFARLGYKSSTSLTNWDLLWTMSYPFVDWFPVLTNLKNHQKVNHLPGALLVTSKLTLSLSKNSFQPKAFIIPNDVIKLQEYARRNPEKQFVQKNINHRGVMITNISDINLKSSEVFIQEYIDRPLLVDGHKFEIGVYTVITSIDPLRVYIYNGDILFRYCPMKYHPFDPSITDKYVTTEFYTPTWELPSLTNYYCALECGMRDSFNYYCESKGINTSKIWSQVERSIPQILLQKERDMREYYRVFKSSQSFFELLRFDFIVDENLRVFLLEVNLSPNLSSMRRPQSAILYEQLLYSTFSLVGIGKRLKMGRPQSDTFMQSTERNVLINESHCIMSNCARRCSALECSLCWSCLEPDMKHHVQEAYREHIDRIECKRIFPPIMNEDEDLAHEYLKGFSPRNRVMMQWFNAKCKQDNTWC